MKYMLLIYVAEDAMDEVAREQCYQKSAQLCQDLTASGQYLDAAPLHPVSTSTSVRVRDGKTVVTDGPFAETREHLGGYFLIDAKDLDEAIGIAASMTPEWTDPMMNSAFRRWTRLRSLRAPLAGFDSVSSVASSTLRPAMPPP